MLRHSARTARVHTILYIYTYSELVTLSSTELEPGQDGPNQPVFYLLVLEKQHASIYRVPHEVKNVWSCTYVSCGASSSSSVFTSKSAVPGASRPRKSIQLDKQILRIELYHVYPRWPRNCQESMMLRLYRSMFTLNLGKDSSKHVCVPNSLGFIGLCLWCAWLVLSTKPLHYCSRLM